jgi:hypothetical protein
MGHINSVLMAISTRPNPTVFQKTLALNDFYFGDRDWDFRWDTSASSEARRRDAVRRRAPDRPGIHVELMAKHSLDFWLTQRGPSRPAQPRHAQQRRRHRPLLSTE